MLNKRNRPLLESFWQHSVVGVAECLCDNIPSSVPFKTFQIDQDALELNNGQRRVGIVQLDSNLICEVLPWSLRLLETSDDIVKRSSTPEILLFQSQLFSSFHVVVRVQDCGDGFGSLLVCDGAFILARVEFGKVEFARGGLA